MRKLIFAAAAAFALVCSGYPALDAIADEAAVVRHGKKARQVCRGPACGPYARCGLACRVGCPDRYSCFPLYGAYAPIGGIGYWGAYTYSGWGPGW